MTSERKSDAARSRAGSGREGKHLPAISLFSNCGAGDLGYSKAGFHFSVMAELEQKRMDVALLNHTGAKGVVGDVRKTWPLAVSAFVENHGVVPPALLAACPPCQGMSSARGDRGLGSDADAGSRDSRNLLASVILKVAAKLSPRVIVVENVPAFLTRLVRHPRTRKPLSAASLLVEELKADYVAYPLVSDLADFGVPQSRRRAFLTFIRRGEPALDFLDSHGRTPYPVPYRGRNEDLAPHVTLREALKSFDLPRLDAGSAVTAGAPKLLPLHTVPVWLDRRREMVAAIPPGSGASAWETDECPECGGLRVPAEVATCPKCFGPLLRPVVRSKNGRYRLIHGFRASSYRRMAPDRAAATITTASGHIGSDLTIHPFEHRVLSPLECALLQTFPRRFRWGDALSRWGQSNVRAMIGEAVPPHFTMQHGRVLASLLDGTCARRMLKNDDRRCRSPQRTLGLKRVEGR